MNERTMRGIVLAAWGAFFIWLLVSGEVLRYIGPRTQWVVVFGAVALVAASVGYWLTRKESRGSGGVLGVAVLLLPIVAVIVVPKPSLGSLAASRKISGGPVVSLQPQPLAPGDEVSFPEIEYASESAEYAATSGISDGLEVELTGFVTRSEDQSADFALTRFSIFCCAADVVPHSVGVDAERDYSDDEWITVQGTLEERDDGFVVVAESVEEIPEPKDPYLR
jgi:uncharacterized repeat protein (TIGR03943 family)